MHRPLIDQLDHTGFAEFPARLARSIATKLGNLWGSNTRFSALGFPS